MKQHGGMNPALSLSEMTDTMSLLNAQPQTALQRIQNGDNATQLHLDSLNELLINDQISDVEQPASPTVSLALAPEPVERDVKRFNDLFRVMLDNYECLIDQSRGGDADDQKARIRKLIADFDAQHGQESRRRLINHILIRRFLELEGRRKAINPVFDIPRERKTDAVEPTILEGRISKTVGTEPAIPENNISKTATAILEKLASRTAGHERSHSCDGHESKNALKTPEIRDTQHIEPSSPSLLTNNVNNYPVILPLNTTSLEAHRNVEIKEKLKTEKKRAEILSPFALAQQEPSPSPNYKPRLKSAHCDIISWKDPYHRRWHDISPDERFILALLETDLHAGFSFRLTFHPDLAKKLLTKNDPATVFCRDHLRPALKAEFGKVLPYCFKFEFSRDDADKVEKLHIHGAIIVPEMERTGIEGRLRAALNKAGVSMHTSSQSHVDLIYDPLRYYRYLNKFIGKTTNKMENNKKGISMISREMKTLCVNRHNEFRIRRIM